MNAIATEAPLPPMSLLRPKKRSRRGFLLLFGAAAIGLIGWQGWERFPRSAKPPTYATAPAVRTDVVSKVTATGTLSPVIQVEVGSQISGRITELHADYNSIVKKGDILARLDPSQMESVLAQARARLSSAYADSVKASAVAANAVAQYARARSLAADGAVSQADADAALANKRSAEASVSSAKAAITVAKAAVEQAELDLSYTTIASPIDGVVVSRSVELGQTVAASLSAPVLFVLAEDLRNMEVHTSVAESDVGQLQPGMAVEFSVDAFPADTFTGTIKQVRYEATTVSNVVTYDAVVNVNNPELKLRPGMTANATFILAASRDVLAVPNKALNYRPSSAGRGNPFTSQRGPVGQRGQRGQRGRRGEQEGAGRRRVFVLRDGEPTMVRLEVGMTDGTSTVVTGGELAEGDLLITGDGSSASTRPTGPAGAQRAGGGRRRGPPSVF